MYRELLQYVPPDKMETNYRRGGGTYPNLFDAHPPFQIDGNFGGAAAVLEMLIQSNENEIRLLPALPDAWDQGSVFGVRTRGGFEVSMEWGDNKPTAVRISSATGGKTTIIHGEKQKVVTVKPGKSVELKW
jgi:alpha-L-fucosidase 2